MVLVNFFVSIKRNQQENVLFPDSDDLCPDELSTTPKNDDVVVVSSASLEKEEKEKMLLQRKAEAQIRRRKKKKTNSSLAATTFKVRQLFNSGPARWQRWSN